MIKSRYSFSRGLGIFILCIFLVMVHIVGIHYLMAIPFGLQYKADEIGMKDLVLLAEARSILEGMGVEYVNGVPLVMWTYFIGPPPTQRRLEQLVAVQEWCKETGITHIHVTRHNFMDFKVGYWPEELQESFPTTDDSPPILLSGVHVSDYLRIYIGYYFGGGYTDVKAPIIDVLNYRDLIMDVANDSSITFTGAGLGGEGGVACNSYGCLAAFGPSDRYCCSRVFKGFSRYGSVAVFASRPGCVILKEIYEHNNQYIVDVADRLRKHPPLSWRCCFAYDKVADDDYPIVWADLLGNITYATQSKYPEQVLVQKYTVEQSLNLSDYWEAQEH